MGGSCENASVRISEMICTHCVVKDEKMKQWFPGTPEKTYRKVASRSTYYYSENQVFGGATNRDMSLNETCFYS